MARKLAVTGSTFGKGISPKPTTTASTTTNRGGAVHGNATTGQNGKGKVLTTEQRRILAAMNRLTAKTGLQNANDISSTTDLATKLFGTALGHVVRQDMEGAVAAAAGGEAETGGAVRGARSLVTGGERALETERRGLAAARMGAAYEAGEIQQEASRDQSLIAQQLAFNKTEAYASMTASQRLAVQQERLDHLNRVREMRLAARLENGGVTGVDASLGEAQDYITGLLADPGTTPEQADAAVRSMVSRYDLGPAAAQKLREQVTQAYPNGSTTSVLAPQPTDAAGNPIPSFPDDEDVKHFRDIAKQNSNGRIDVTDDNAILGAIGIAAGTDPEGNLVYKVGDTTVSASYVASALNIFRQTYAKFAYAPDPGQAAAAESWAGTGVTPQSAGETQDETWIDRHFGINGSVLPILPS